MKLDQIIKQLDCLNPTEAARLSRAVNEKLCAQPKGLPNIVDMLGYVGLIMQIQWEADWEAEKSLPVTEPTP